MADQTLTKLVDLIKARRKDSASKSYTKQLLDGGPEKCARKLGEEALEVVIAGLGSDPKAIKAEAADLIYHLLVLLECKGVAFTDVTEELERRLGTSGLAEKAARSAQ